MRGREARWYLVTETGPRGARRPLLATASGCFRSSGRPGVWGVAVAAFSGAVGLPLWHLEVGVGVHSMCGTPAGCRRGRRGVRVPVLPFAVGTGQGTPPNLSCFVETIAVLQGVPQKAIQSPNEAEETNHNNKS